VPVRAALLTCLVLLVVGGCRGAEPTLGPLPAEPANPKLRKIAQGLEAQWTADGRIVYVSSRDGDIWSVRPDGKRPRRVVKTKSSVGLLVSPDRSRMLLLRADRNLVAWTDAERARPVAEVSQASTARWSDDGSMITFQRLRDGQRSIWAVPARGGRPERLFGEFGGFVLAWAADGRMIVRAFQEKAGGSFRATLLVSADGEPTEIPELVEARFLPDGTIEGIESQGSLVVLKNDGTVVRRFDVDALPDYSPNRRFLVYAHAERVWVARSDWSAPFEIAKGLCLRPSFSPDGSQVVCSLLQTKRNEARRYVAVVGLPSELR
jgi:WD40-like Beta Propeller Repeat